MQDSAFHSRERYFAFKPGCCATVCMQNAPGKWFGFPALRKVCQQENTMGSELVVGLTAL